MKNKICSIITMVLCVLIPICMVFPLVKLDLSPITGSISTFFSDAELWEDGVKYSVIDIFKVLRDYKEDLGKYFWLFIGCGLLQYVFTLVIFILSWLKGKMKYIVNLILAAVGAIVTLVMHMFLIPEGIEKVVTGMLDDSIVGGVLDFFHVGNLTDTFAQEAAKVYTKSLSLGFYLPLVLLALIAAASVAGIAMYKETVGQAGAAKGGASALAMGGKSPALVGITGIFKGAEIPIAKGEVLVIGRDPSQCHVIIESNDISRKHCAVSFDEITGQYKVTDYSANGTFINNERRVMKNQPQFVQRGEVISVGGSKNSFRLN